MRNNHLRHFQAILTLNPARYSLIHDKVPQSVYGFLLEIQFRINFQICRCRLLKRRGKSSHQSKIPASRLFIKSFRVASLTDRERASQKDEK